MGRTQVYRGDGELELLGEQRRDKKLRALKDSAGSWGGRRTNGAEYVDAIRGTDLNDRLARLGVK